MPVVRIQECSALPVRIYVEIIAEHRVLEYGRSVTDGKIIELHPVHIVGNVVVGVVVCECRCGIRGGIDADGVVIDGVVMYRIVLNNTSVESLDCYADSTV